MIAPPPVDRRDLEAILRQVGALAPFYTPEWRASADDGAGSALVEIFARQLEGLIARLNQVPGRSFIAFLNSLGLHLLPAQPARAALTFALSAGAREAVVVPPRTQAAASPPGGDPILFETDRTILATPARLQSLVSVVPADDQVFDYAALLAGGGPIELFAPAARNRQEHSLYLAHAELLGIKGRAVVTVRMVLDEGGPSAQDVARIVSWEWWNGERWVPSTVPAMQEDLLARQAAADLDGTVGPASTTLAEALGPDEAAALVVETDVEGDARFPATGLILVGDEIIQYRAKSESTFTGLTRAVNSDPSGTRFTRGTSQAVPHPAGEKVWAVDEPLVVAAKVGQEGARRTLSVALVKDFDAELKKATVAGIESHWIRCRLPSRVQLATSPFHGLQVDTIQLATSAPERSPIEPEALARNDVPLDQPAEDAPIYPFGTLPRTGDAFYLASGDAFSKRGAAVTLTFVVPNGSEPVGVGRVPGIGRARESRLLAAGIVTADELIARPADELAVILRVSPERASTVIDAGRETIGASGVRPSPGAAADGQDGPVLSWEYWNGLGWALLPVTTDTTNSLRRSGTVTYTVPPEIAPATVTGQESSWVRVRIANGDYGREQFIFSGTTWDSDTSAVTPPVLSGVTIGYEYASPVPVERCLTLNSLDYVDRTVAARTSDAPFAPFELPDAERQSLFFGFDRPPIGGPISIFFSLVEQEYAERGRPRLTWEYLATRVEDDRVEWRRLPIVDGTRALTESGTVEFIGPPDLARAARFGQALYWLRTVDVDDRFRSAERRTAAPPAEEEPPEARAEGAADDHPCGCGLVACDELLGAFRPPFSLPPGLDDPAPAPLLNGVHPNTTWASQAESVRDEILGSGTGLAGQQYTFAKRPVIEEEISIDGELWTPIDDLGTAGPTDRVYAIDRTFGQVRFGDGEAGMIPPVGRDNLRATYRTGGGTRGNVGAGLIKALRTTIPYVDRVVNPEAAGGGSDTEPLVGALERGPRSLRHRGRAVTREDFEWLALEASRAVARARCLPTFDDRGRFQTGWVTVIIVPGDDSPRPSPSPQLRQLIEDSLRERAANVVTFPRHLRVTGPTYVGVGVAGTLVPRTLDLAPQVEASALARLRAFLHPLTGGYQDRGWEFGRLPCLSDFYALLEGIPGVDYVRTLAVNLTAFSPIGMPLGEARTVTEDRPLGIGLPEYALVSSGEHHLTLQAPG